MKSLLKGLLRRFGLDLNRWPHPELPAGVLKRLIAEQGITTAIDVGANTGQFAEELIQHGFRGTIVSFEPQAAAFAELARKAARRPRWLAERCALGAAEGEIDLHLAANSVSSSVLPMRESHRSAAPASAYGGVEKVRLRRLDDALADLLRDDVGSSLLLKIDTQGYEDRVLDGAPRTLARCRMVELELSLLPLYDGQKLMHEMLARMEAEGFHLRALFPAWRTAERLMQVDGIFTRAKAG